MNPGSMLKNVGALFAFIITMPLMSAESDPHFSPPPSEIAAPNKKSSVSIEHRALPGSDRVDEFFTLVLHVHGRPVREVSTMGYLLDAFWSPNSRYVAVNNRRSNAGDYLWVFSLPGGQVLEAPDDARGAVLAQRAATKFPELALADFDRFSNVAKGWTGSGELEVESRIVFHRPNVVIIRRALYQVEEGELVLRKEDFKKTPLRSGSSDKMGNRTSIVKP
jgi:hypothetical protein